MIQVRKKLNDSWITLPSPSTYEWTYTDVDKDSGRNDAGLMMRNRIDSKVKLTLSWNADQNPSLNAQMVAILKGLPPFFYCKYLSGDNTVKEMECYRGDIKRSLFRYDPESNSMWKETSCNFIQR